MTTQWTEADYEQLTWHDNYIYSFKIDVGDVDQNEWRSHLVLDIDHITEWVRHKDRFEFRVAPATLVFEHTTDLKIEVAHRDTGYQGALHEWSIDRIEREQVTDQKVCLDRPYYAWRIALNWPQGGFISFGAAGFTQGLRAMPILQDEQKLSSKGQG